MTDMPMLVLRGADLGAAELQARTKLPPTAVVDLYEVRRVNRGTISPRAALGWIPVVAIRTSRSEYNQAGRSENNNPPPFSQSDAPGKYRRTHQSGTA
jgi:hypothetical protein